MDGEIGFAGLHHRGANGRIGAEEIGRLRHFRLLAPVVFPARQHDLLAGRPVGQLVGAGTDRLAHEFERRFLGYDGDERHQQRQDRLGRIGLEVDRVVVDDLGRYRHAAEVAARFTGVLVAHDTVEAVLDVLRVEARAIGELDALAQVEAPASVGVLLPLFGKARHDALVAAHVELGQCLADILHDDAADIRARRHAGLQEIGLLGQDDLDGARPGESRRQGGAQHEGPQDKHSLHGISSLVNFVQADVGFPDRAAISAAQQMSPPPQSVVRAMFSPNSANPPSATSGRRRKSTGATMVAGASEKA